MINSIKPLGKLFAVLFGLLGLSSLFSSCTKETTCDCTSTHTYTYTYGEETYTYTYSTKFEATVEGKCETLEFNGGDGGVLKCEEG